MAKIAPGFSWQEAVAVVLSTPSFEEDFAGQLVWFGAVVCKSANLGMVPLDLLATRQFVFSLRKGFAHRVLMLLSVQGQQNIAACTCPYLSGSFSTPTFPSFSIGTLPSLLYPPSGPTPFLQSTSLCPILILLNSCIHALPCSHSHLFFNRLPSLPYLHTVPLPLRSASPLHHLARVLNVCYSICSPPTVSLVSTAG
jgi:hypothetical protein